ncbi:zinc-binding dehydrogenase [Dactylosporangium sp. AC04546]|uniref:alcohol dehydrogenase catalytic domain-containing protein n=1 Tax=Dactylosporangium sp. AC04546 TaxID=2862460 RepID=UPI001EDDF9BD|nr:zinc-binding dehydrogenase [Dactylosporangium sp. AC04546]WVK87261.1 zinc-binding dehydrogenase [Dactylosporangium sp. AC04546]
MRALVVTSLDGPGALALRDVPRPVPAPGEVTIRVHAAGVGRAPSGWVPSAPPFVLGAAVAGTVLAAPPGSGRAPGDRVLAFCPTGGAGEVAVARAAHTVELPARLTFEQGAASLVPYLSAYFAVVERGRLAAGESVLVRGAGGFCSAALRVARASGAGRIVGAGEPSGDAGVERVPIDGFRDAVRSVGAVDLVVDSTGGDGFVDALRCLAVEGRAVLAGGSPGEIRVNRLLLNNIEVVGAAWEDWVCGGDGRLAGEWSAIGGELARGSLAPIAGRVLPLDDGTPAALDLGRPGPDAVIRIDAETNPPVG